jgi:hypothetical protein
MGHDMNGQPKFQTARPAPTVAFGDVTPSRPRRQLSISEARAGVEDSTATLDQGPEVDTEADPAQGITSERRPRAEGQVDATPLSQRS